MNEVSMRRGRQVNLVGAGAVAVLLCAIVSCGAEQGDLRADAGAVDASPLADTLPPDPAADGGQPPATAGTIRGTVSLQTNIFPPPPGDLSGPVIVAAVDGVPMLGGQPVALQTIHADLSRGPVAFELTDVPPGRYSVSAMLDDNDSFQPTAPFDAGDVINPLAITVEVGAGEETTVDIVLDTPVPGQAPYCGSGALDEQKRQCVFDFIWSFAKRNYPFFELKEIDWEAVKASYQPRVALPGTAIDFHFFVAEILAELRDAHCALATREALGDLQTVRGVKLAHVAGEVFVERVEPGSAAALAGLQVGDRLLSVDGKTFADHAARFGKYVAHPNDHWYHHMLVSSWPIGAAGSVAKLAIERDSAVLDVSRSSAAEAAGPLVVSKRFFGASGKEYGYIHITTFLTPEIVPQFDAALDSLLDVHGLILDVRENGGGESAVGHAMIARLIESPVLIAKDHLRGSLEQFVITELQPRPSSYDGPIAVLTDEVSYSNGHLFPSQLKGIGRVTLVGRTTGGGSAAIERWQLTDALRVQLSKALSLTASGSAAEEMGTQPDVVVERTAADIKAGLYSELGVFEHDIVLQRAIDELDKASGS